MKICPRCTTRISFDAQVCTGCCLTFQADVAPVTAAPITAAFVPPGTPAADNPWRQQTESVESYPAPAYPAEPAQYDAPAAAYEPPPVYEPPAVEEPVHVEAPVAAPVAAQPAGLAAVTASNMESSQRVVLSTAPIGTSIPLTFADPLPPIAPVAEPVAAATVAIASDAPSIPIAPSEGFDTPRENALPVDETLATPAAFATWAEPAAVDSTTALEAAAADVVELQLPATLGVAAPAAPVAEWTEEAPAASAGY